MPSIWLPGKLGPFAQSLLRLTPGQEKLTQLGSCLFLANPSKHVRPVVAGRLRKKTRPIDHSAALGVLGAKPQRLDPRQGDRRGAHGAGLQRYPQGAAVEPRPTQSGSRMADGDYF